MTIEDFIATIPIVNLHYFRTFSGDIIANSFSGYLGNRRGISIILVAATLLVVSVFAVSMHLLAVENLRRNRRIADVQAAVFLRQAAVANAVSSIQEGLKNEKSEIRKILLSENLKPGTLLPLSFDHLNSLALNDYNAEVSCQALIKEIAPLDPERLGIKSGGLEPRERRMKLSIISNVSVNDVSFDHHEVRELKTIHLGPGVLGKFTLFLSEPESNSKAYNLFAADIRGRPDDQILPEDRFLPIVLKNGGELDEENNDFPVTHREFKRGYVFWGGESDFNLTSGFDPAFGEAFQFLDLQEKIDKASYYHQEAPDFFCRNGDFSKPRYQQILNPQSPFASSFAYAVRFLQSGFFTSDFAGDNMNKDGRLKLSFPGPAQKIDSRMKSSIFKIFGNRANPCPTLVIGKLNRCHARFSAIVVEADGDNDFDGVVGLLPEMDGNRLDIPAFPESIKTRGRLAGQAESIRLDQALLIPGAVFPDELSYRTAMSTTVKEPYLKSLEKMYSYKKIETDFNKHLKSCEILFSPTYGRKEPFFSEGDLKSLPADFLISKSNFHFKSLDELLKRLVDPETGKLELDGVALVENDVGKSHEFPAELIFSKGGIIIFSGGNVLLKSVLRDFDPDQSLTLVNIDGNFEIDASRGGVIEARLVALKGTVINRTVFGPLNITGGLCLKKFNPRSFPAGGKIAFDGTFDPCRRNWLTHLRCKLADFPESVSFGD